MDIRLNYGKGSVNLNIPEDTVAGIYEPKYIPGFVDLQGELRRAISHPIGSDPLTRKLHTDSKVVIVVDDITRPVPNAKILPVIIDYLAEQGISPENITVLVGLGIHPPMRKETLAELPGSSEGRVRLVNHTPDDDSALTLVGTTSFGTQVRLNNRFLEADVRIVLGDIEYHQFCGYGGGAKSLFPGIADRASIQANHARQFTDGARKGLWTGNPVRQEIEEVGQMVRVDLAVNVVLNHRHEVVGCYAGDIQQAFLEGISLVERMYKDTISHPVDLVLTSPGDIPMILIYINPKKQLMQPRQWSNLTVPSFWWPNVGKAMVLTSFTNGCRRQSLFRILFNDIIKDLNWVGTRLINLHERFTGMIFTCIQLNQIPLWKNFFSHRSQWRK